MDREDIQLLIDQLDTTLDNIKEIMDKKWLCTTLVSQVMVLSV